MALKWNGKRVTARFRAAQAVGVNATMAASVIHAKRNHTWTNRTGILERSIGTAQNATFGRRGVRGVWGSIAVAYALIHELGGQAGRGLAATIRARPYLRPAAAAQYPGLARRIRIAMT